MAGISLKEQTNWELKILVFLAVMVVIYFSEPLLFPLFIVFFLYLLFSPLHEWLLKYKIPAGISAAVITLLLATLIALSINFLVDPATDWLKKVPTFINTLEDKFIIKSIEKIKATEIADKITDINQVPPIKTTNILYSIFNMTSTTLVFLATVFIFLFFSLIYFKPLIQDMEKLRYRKQERKENLEFYMRIKHHLSIYFFTFSLICLGIGTVMGFIFWILKIPNPFMWGVMVTLLTFIPYFGNFLGIIVIFFVSLVTFDNWLPIILPPLFYVIVAFLEGQVITPYLLGARLNINPLIILLSMLFWGWIWGISGLIISVPLLVIIKIVMGRMPEFEKYKSVLEI